ncbi:helix-turn-helix domain-containing protein [Streptomyces telluris]|uniref:helix-turn-helix domain-containing protein n=1 Tax=Streptomyces telluris TaxID=2720021 RepID=UPI00143A308A|nr:transcriptional regulator [Streptomyces telluris]
MEGGKHYDADQRRRIGAELRALYEDGASIRDLTRSTGRSYGFVHRVLLEAGVTLRGRGGPRVRRAGRGR